ncbi:peptidase, S9A family, beta-propeller domain protein [Cooperia oncophora]
MEDPDAEETRHFVDQLNAISESFLAKAPSREKIRKRLTELWNYEKYSCPSKHGDFYYYQYNTGLQNQSVLYQQKNVTEKGEVFLDPNTLSPDGTIALADLEWTNDGSLLAYALSENGSDWTTVKFRSVDKKDLEDTITGVKSSALAWMKDKSGIFYSKFPDHKSSFDGKSVEKDENHSLYFHRMGTDYKDDVLVYDRKNDSNLLIAGTVTEDGRFLIIDVSQASSNMLYYYDLSSMKGPIGRIHPTPLFDKLDALYQYVDHDNDSMLILTDHDAPMFKLIRISLKDKSIKEVIPENPRHKLDWARPVANDRLVVSYIEDVKHALYVHDLNTGSRLYSIPLKMGEISGFFAKKGHAEMFLCFESFLVPTIVYRLDFAATDRDVAPELQELRRVRVPGMDEGDFAVRQVFYESKDKTKIPMYIISLKAAPRNGDSPTILYGYGGFGTSMMPGLSLDQLFFVRHFNGYIAWANLRGGG